MENIEKLQGKKISPEYCTNLSRKLQNPKTNVLPRSRKGRIKERVNSRKIGREGWFQEQQIFIRTTLLELCLHRCSVMSFFSPFRVRTRPQCHNEIFIGNGVLRVILAGETGRVRVYYLRDCIDFYLSRVGY